MSWGREPKYLNSPRQSCLIRAATCMALIMPDFQEGYLLICEGYLDVISCTRRIHQCGGVPGHGIYQPARQHVLKRHGPGHLTYDSDGAGIKAASGPSPSLRSGHVHQGAEHEAHKKIRMSSSRTWGPMPSARNGGQEQLPVRGGRAETGLPDG